MYVKILSGGGVGKGGQVKAPLETNPDLQMRVLFAPMVLKTRKPIFHQLIKARPMLRGPINSTNTSRT